ncbi:hypothetical protein A5659_03550 [Mycobacterium sp. 1165196.3]|uniref:hypothetical protein n=1 Tax=Mycobacterium sp. 1165196.3 TaxID=1834071 RepID=UPI0007FC68AC|nr:hypothetical protein [Mycobacterium sp. 1165196.3]OBK30128.1 hypothetical protein A5659_03550 [Mycobacterium sp. 1165196.3]
MTTLPVTRCFMCNQDGHDANHCTEGAIPIEMPDYAETWDGTGPEGHPGFRIVYNGDADPADEVVVYGFLTESGDLIRAQLLMGDYPLSPNEARELAATLVKAADELERLDPLWVTTGDLSACSGF